MKDLHGLLKSGTGKEGGKIKGFNPCSVLQLFEIERKTGIVNVRCNGKTCKIYFTNGEIDDIEMGNVQGIEALSEVLDYPDPEIEIFLGEHGRPKKIHLPLEEVLLEAACLKDEKQKNKKEVNMTKYDALLAKLQEVPGYIASAIYTPEGEIVAYHSSKGDLKDVFVRTSSILAQTQKATDGAGLTGLDVIQMEVDVGTLIAVKGKHAIVSLLLEEGGNVGMAKLTLKEIADNI